MANSFMLIPRFKDQSLLETALTHRSALNERNPDKPRESNERLEYLGDAVLELVTSEYLFKRFPKEPEGKLTAYRSALVKTETLAQVAKQLNLGEKLKLSKGEEKSGGRHNQSLLANTFEAIVGALYLDQGLESVRKFLHKHLFPKVDAIIKQQTYLDPKSYLQELVQAKGLPTPSYRLVKEAGPDHNKTFTIQVMIENKVAGTGQGKSKQQAQREAAKTAIEKYN